MRQRRYRIASPSRGDIAHWALLREVERNQLAAEEIEAIREREEYMLANAKAALHTVPAVPGLDAAARRLGCEDQYENDLRARYGDTF